MTAAQAAMAFHQPMRCNSPTMVSTLSGTLISDPRNQQPAATMLATTPMTPTPDIQCHRGRLDPEFPQARDQRRAAFPKLDAGIIALAIGGDVALKAADVVVAVTRQQLVGPIAARPAAAITMHGDHRQVPGDVAPRDRVTHRLNHFGRTRCVARAAPPLTMADLPVSAFGSRKSKKIAANIGDLNGVVLNG